MSLKKKKCSKQLKKQIKHNLYGSVKIKTMITIVATSIIILATVSVGLIMVGWEEPISLA